jgi:hypothetical protein
VKDALGWPIAGASIVLRAFDGRTSIHTTTSPAGAFRFAASEAGTYNLTVNKKSFRDAERLVTLPDQVKPFDLILQAENALTLKVSAARIRAELARYPAPANCTPGSTERRQVSCRRRLVSRAIPHRIQPIRFRCFGIDKDVWAPVLGLVDSFHCPPGMKPLAAPTSRPHGLQR